MSRALAVCETTMARSRRLMLQGNGDEAARTAARIYDCRGRASLRCPRARICAKRFPAPPRTPTTMANQPGLLVADSPARNIVVNGHRTRHGVINVETAADKLGNEIVVRTLDLDLARGYEDSGMRTFLAMYEAKQRPTMNDIGLDTLARHSWLPWLYKMGFNDPHNPRYLHCGDGIVTYFGTDHTGRTLGDLGSDSHRLIMGGISSRVRLEGRPHYGRITRVLNMPGAIPSLSYRRLEVPIFEGSSVTGSLVYFSTEG